jgi:hypothetical protein
VIGHASLSVRVLGATAHPTAARVGHAGRAQPGHGPARRRRLSGRVPLIPDAEGPDSSPSTTPSGTAQASSSAPPQTSNGTTCGSGPGAAEPRPRVTPAVVDHARLAPRARTRRRASGSRPRALPDTRRPDPVGPPRRPRRPSVPTSCPPRYEPMTPTGHNRRS